MLEKNEGKTMSIKCMSYETGFFSYFQQISNLINYFQGYLLLVLALKERNERRMAYLFFKETVNRM